jgi:hypothetical protein
LFGQKNKYYAVIPKGAFIIKEKSCFDCCPNKNKIIKSIKKLIKLLGSFRGTKKSLLFNRKFKFNLN